MNYTDNPLLFIMLPTLNRSKLILRAVNSILQQSYSNYYLWIFNDGSTEDYSELENLIKNHTNIKYIKSKNIGINKSRNMMLESFSKEYDISNAYFCTLSDDDYFTPDAFYIIKEEVIKFKNKPWLCFNCESLSQDIFKNKNYNNYTELRYKDFVKRYRGDKHFIFNFSLVGHIQYPDYFFKNGYEHIFYFKVPGLIQTIPKTVKVIEYQPEGLSLSDLSQKSNSFEYIVKYIRLDPKNIYYYKLLIKKIYVSLLPKNILKLIISTDRYYWIKKTLGLKVPDKYK